VFVHQRVFDDARHRHARANEQLPAALFQPLQVGDGGNIHQGMHRFVPPLLQFQQQVGAAGHRPG
jgi:hypothetical protein